MPHKIQNFSIECFMIFNLKWKCIQLPELKMRNYKVKLIFLYYPFLNYFLPHLWVICREIITNSVLNGFQKHIDGNDIF